MNGKYTTQAGGRGPRAMRGLMAAAAIIAFVFAACGDDSGDTAGNSSPSSPARTRLWRSASNL